MNPNSSPVPIEDQIPATELSQEEVALCAYAIWESEGRPEGRDAEHWRQAEAQLRATRAVG